MSLKLDTLPRPWIILTGCLIALGLFFRVVQLDQAVYWVDEVATSMRVSGYTLSEVQQILLQQHEGIIFPADLLSFQSLRPGSSWRDVFQVLAQSPEHAPLYFLLARQWALWFGTGVGTMRSLSVVFGLLALPVAFWTAEIVFRQRSVACLATGLLAVSPFFVAYSQEARPYSLWLLLLLLVTGTLWRSLQRNHWSWWIGYGLALTLSLYTSLLTLLVVVGQGMAVLLIGKRRQSYLIATGAALMAFSPWLWVIASHWQVLQGNTDWMREPLPLWAILGIWHYSLAVLFFDVPVVMRPLVLGLQVGVATGFVALMGYGLWLVGRRVPQGSLLVAGALSTPLALLLVDLLRNGQAAATPRYLVPTQLVLLLAVAYVLGRPTSRPRLWRGLTALLLTVSIGSCLIGINHMSPYQKSRNRSNLAIATLINEETAPLVVAEVDQVQDVVSLSYELDGDVEMYLVQAGSELQKGWEEDHKDHPVFVFNPSEETQRRVEESFGNLDLVYEPIRLIPSEIGLTLWRVESER